MMYNKVNKKIPIHVDQAKMSAVKRYILCLNPHTAQQLQVVR